MPPEEFEPTILQASGRRLRLRPSGHWDRHLTGCKFIFITIPESPNKFRSFETVTVLKQLPI